MPQLRPHETTTVCGVVGVLVPQGLVAATLNADVQ
jgi:hypothetical protein